MRKRARVTLSNLDKFRRVSNNILISILIAKPEELRPSEQVLRLVETALICVWTLAASKTGRVLLMLFTVWKLVDKKSWFSEARDWQS